MRLRNDEYPAALLLAFPGLLYADQWDALGGDFETAAGRAGHELLSGFEQHVGRRDIVASGSQDSQSELRSAAAGSEMFLRFRLPE
jgi:hypothetical protein